MRTSFASIVVFALSLASSLTAAPLADCDKANTAVQRERTEPAAAALLWASDSSARYVIGIGKREAAPEPEPAKTKTKTKTKTKAPKPTTPSGGGGNASSGSSGNVSGGGSHDNSEGGNETNDGSSTSFPLLSSSILLDSDFSHYYLGMV